MPHLKRLFRCGRQERDNTSAIKMLHQMSVGVVQLGMRLPLTGVKIPKIGKRGFRSQKKKPFPTTPEKKGCSESKIPHSPCSALYRIGDFLTWSALFWGGGKWGFLTPKPSFPDFGDFDPYIIRGKRIPNCSCCLWAGAD